MAARNDLLEALMRVIEGKRPQSLYAGELPEKAFQELHEINPLYTKPRAIISNHGIFSRMEKDGWTPEKTTQAYAKLLNSLETLGIPNFTGGNRSASEALWLPQGEKGLFAPSVPLSGGEAKILTVYDPEIEKVLAHLKNIDWPSGVRHPSMSGVHRAISVGEPSSQPQRLSAVEDHSLFNGTDSRRKVKSLLPYILGGGAAGAAMTPDAATAQQWEGFQITEPPLESPTLDPIDNIIAALTGPVGMAGKAVAGAVETPLSFALDNVLKGVGKGWEWMGGRSPIMQEAR